VPLIIGSGVLRISRSAVLSERELGLFYLGNETPRNLSDKSWWRRNWPIIAATIIVVGVAGAIIKGVLASTEGIGYSINGFTIGSGGGYTEVNTNPYYFPFNYIFGAAVGRTGIGEENGFINSWVPVNAIESFAEFAIYGLVGTAVVKKIAERIPIKKKSRMQNLFVVQAGVSLSKMHRQERQRYQ
jgi:hypothetical protein